MVTDTVLGVRREGRWPPSSWRGKRSTPSTSSCSTLLGATLGRLEGDDDVSALVLTAPAGSSRPGWTCGGWSTPTWHMGSASWRACAARRDTVLFSQADGGGRQRRRLAGGCILACVCDRRVMAQGARIGASELVVGVPFPVAVSRSCATRAERTEDVCFGGRLLDAAEALALGMVHEVVGADAVLERATAVAAELAGRGPLAYRLAKEQLRRAAVQRMRADAGTVDDSVIAEWAAPHTVRRLREQLERLAAPR